MVVGVSGGPDSLALLHHLHSLGIPLLAATFNHQLRAEAAQDVEFVRSVASQLGVPFVSDSADVAAYAREQHLSIEQAARELRYQFLFREARKSGAQAVAVGHTADDQAETVLMHFVRGSGLAGLRGMSARMILPVFDPEIPIIRPLLDWTRSETEAYCRQHNLQARVDESNTDTTYFRNRLRHELLPALEQYNPRIRQSLVKTALALQGDYQLLDEVVESAWQTTVRRTDEGYVCFDLATLQSQSLALRRNLIRKAAYFLSPGERDVDFEALARAATLKAVDIAGGLKTIVEEGNLYLTFNLAKLPVEWPQVIEPLEMRAGEISLGNGWVICVEVVEGDVYGAARENQEKFTAWLEAENASGSLCVRGYRSGDKFEPLGMPHQTTKLAELFINQKIPKRLRACWPIVCVGDEIAWVAGIRLSEKFKITENTPQAIKIEIKKEQGSTRN